MSLPIFVFLVLFLTLTSEFLKKEEEKKTPAQELEDAIEKYLAETKAAHKE